MLTGLFPTKDMHTPALPPLLRFAPIPVEDENEKSFSDFYFWSHLIAFRIYGDTSLFNCVTKQKKNVQTSPSTFFSTRFRRL